MQLRDKRVLVTGAALGLGLAIAERFAQEGAAVALNDINRSEISSVVDRLARSGRRVVGILGDVSSAEDAERVVAEAVQALGGIDVLVNNAGIVAFGSVTAIDGKEWQRQFAVNVDGVYHMSKFAIPEILKSSAGAIVNVSSASAFIASPMSAAYCASKAAVVQLTRCMAIDYAPAVRVNCVCPGPMETPMLRRGFSIINPDNPDQPRRAYENMTLVRRIARTEEVANCVAFLASDQASYVTGHAFVVDGGASLQWSGFPAEEVDSAAAASKK